MLQILIFGQEYFVRHHKKRIFSPPYGCWESISPKLDEAFVAGLHSCDSYYSCLPPGKGKIINRLGVEAFEGT
jgi:hypothetical protein